MLILLQFLCNGYILTHKYIIDLNESLLKQKKVDIKKIYYLLTESKDNSERILKDNKIDYELIKKRMV